MLSARDGGAPDILVDVLGYETKTNAQHNAEEADAMERLYGGQGSGSGYMEMMGLGLIDPEGGTRGW